LSSGERLSNFQGHGSVGAYGIAPCRRCHMFSRQKVGISYSIAIHNPHPSTSIKRSSFWRGGGVERKPEGRGAHHHELHIMLVVCATLVETAGTHGTPARWSKEQPDKRSGCKSVQSLDRSHVSL
jgi:hypothetical protein